MNKLIGLGAINKKTHEYVHPKFANKKDSYICPECDEKLIFCKGRIVIPHFRHYVDNQRECKHYTHPSESQIHKDAKLLMKNLLEKKVPIVFIRRCNCCEEYSNIRIPKMKETSEIKLEHRFNYDGQKIADVAYIDDDKISYIFEICNTHKTEDENRPEPWFEIDSRELLNIVDKSDLSKLFIECIRDEKKCLKCIETEKKKKEDELKNNRVKEELEKKRIEEELENKRTNSIKLEKYIREKLEKSQLKINFHANSTENAQNNKKIMKLFCRDFNGNEIITRTLKGCIWCFIVDVENYKKYDWHCSDDDTDISLPYTKSFFFSECDNNTIKIITTIITYFENLNKPEVLNTDNDI